MGDWWLHLLKCSILEKQQRVYGERKGECAREERKQKLRVPTVVQLVRAELRFNQIVAYHDVLFLLTCLSFSFLICNIDKITPALQVVIKVIYLNYCFLRGAFHLPGAALITSQCNDFQQPTQRKMSKNIGKKLQFVWRTERST